MLIKQNVLYGSNVLDNPVIQTHGNQFLRFEGKCHNSGSYFSLTKEQLSAHLALIGSTFSGKTNTLKSVIFQLKSKLGPNDIMIVFDSKYDFRDFHGHNDFVISNCQSSRATNVNWNIFGDITSDGWDFESIYLNAIELAKVAFEDRIKKSTQPFFPQAAMEIFAAVITAMALIGSDDKDFRLNQLNNYELRRYLRKLDAKKLADFLGKFPELTGVLKYVGNGRSDQALGVFAELEEGAIFLTSIFAKKGSFSIRRATRNRGGRTIFLEYDPSYGTLGIPLRMVTDLPLKEALSPKNKKGNVYVIIDEFKMLSPLNYIENALNFGRSLGVSVIVGIQSIEQLYETYGEYRGKNILSGFQSSFVFRTNNSATREYVKGINGQNLTNIQYLDAAQKPKDTIREGNVIEDWNITSLNQGQAIISLPSTKPFIFQFSKYK